ncbi:hypothetical protein [uncultured Spongiibacter sp.]|uniref:hypothetical protein n=1 Tax=uncultured Spongiibacter sp. TaxID=870896 RepID=UPI002592A889|nr:hypothetical protein [uncultured Spongiibacter sp.]
MARFYVKLENQKIIIDPNFDQRKLEYAIPEKKVTMKLYIFESTKDKGVGGIDFFAFGKNILTGDFTIKIIDNNLNVYIEKMTIKINGQPEQVKMALREDTEFYLDGFKVDSKTYSPIGGSLKEEKFTGKYYDKIAKKQVRKEASRYIINTQVSSKEFK